MVGPRRCRWRNQRLPGASQNLSSLPWSSLVMWRWSSQCACTAPPLSYLSQTWKAKEGQEPEHSKLACPQKIRSLHSVLHTTLLDGTAEALLTACISGIPSASLSVAGPSQKHSPCTVELEGRYCMWVLRLQTYQPTYTPNSCVIL